jgi:AcrR family transcriptional regulator
MSSVSAVLGRAPARGRYDRSASRAERDERQRELLIAAARRVLAGHAKPTVQSISAQAGTGRNALYRHFASLKQLLADVARHADQRAAARIESTACGAATPLERLRALVRGWLAFVAEEPELARIVVASPRAPSPLRVALAAAVARGRAEGALAAPPDELRIDAVAAALEGAARSLLAPSAQPPADAATVMCDLVVRAFR